MKRIAIFASGNGSNAQVISEYFNDHPEITVSLILSNKKEAYVLQRAKIMNIPSFVFSRQEFYKTDKVLNILKKYKIDFIVLAGFLWLVPENILKVYNNKIINIHPALLPKYGGKGMHGNRVHKAVIENHDKESGITIHKVNEKYDEGEIVFQVKCPVEKFDDHESLAKKVHQLEYKYYPKIIEKLLTK